MRGSVPEATRRDVPTAMDHVEPQDCPARTRGEIGLVALRPPGGLCRDTDSGRREERRGPPWGHDAGTAAGPVTRPGAPADQAACPGTCVRSVTAARAAPWGPQAVPSALRRPPGDVAGPCAPPSRPGTCTGSPQRGHELPEPGPAQTAGCGPLARPPPRVQQGQALWGAHPRPGLRGSQLAGAQTGWEREGPGPRVGHSCVHGPPPPEYLLRAETQARG